MLKIQIPMITGSRMRVPALELPRGDRLVEEFNSDFVPGPRHRSAAAPGLFV
jgi:hypothetical protein